MKIGIQSQIKFLDNRNGISTIPDNSIALTFTSPPYWNFIDYAENKGIGHEDSYNEYLNSLEIVFNLVAEKTIPGGRLVINITNLKSRKAIEGKSFIYPLVSDIIRRIQNCNLTFFDEIIWIKSDANAGALNGRPLFGSYPYPPTPKILDSIFENILIFTKEGKRSVPSDIKQQSKISKDDWQVWTKGIWKIPTDRDTDHPATFPIELAERIIQLYSFTGDRILDPFAGTGTAIIAAEKHNRIGIGFEISKTYKKSIRNKSLKWLTQLQLPGMR